MFIQSSSLLGDKYSPKWPRHVPLNQSYDSYVTLPLKHQEQLSLQLLPLRVTVFEPRPPQDLHFTCKQSLSYLSHTIMDLLTITLSCT